MGNHYINKNVAVADVLNSMIGLPDDISIHVFAIEKNKAYNKIDNNKLASVDFTYVSNVFTDDSSENVKNLIKIIIKKTIQFLLITLLKVLMLRMMY